jgi:hypothetical protein
VVLWDLDPQVVTPGRERLLREALRALAAGELDMGLETAAPRDG